MAGFFDDWKNKHVGMSGYVSAEERDKIIENETVFQITDVVLEPEAKYGPRFLLSIFLEGEPRKLTFSSTAVPSRAGMLTDMVDYFANGEAGLTMVTLTRLDPTDNRSAVFINPVTE